MSKILHTPFCRIGTKKRMIHKLLHLVPKYKTYVECFCGTASMFFRLEQNTEGVEVINDLDDVVYKGLVSLKEFNIDKLEFYKRLFDKSSYTEDEYTKILNEYKIKIFNEVEPEYDFLKFLFSCYTFGSKNLTEKLTLYKNTDLKPKIDEIPRYKKRLENTIITRLDYKEIIKDYDSPDTFFFIDPPYEKTEYLYKHSKKGFDYIELSNILKEIKGKFLLTINDSENIRELFSGYKIIPIVVKSYSHKVGTMGNKDRNEIIIMNL